MNQKSPNKSRGYMDYLLQQQIYYLRAPSRDFSTISFREFHNAQIKNTPQSKNEKSQPLCHTNLGLDTTWSHLGYRCHNYKNISPVQ